MATGTSGDERDDETTEPIGADVDTETDAAEPAGSEAEADEAADETAAAAKPAAKKSPAKKAPAKKPAKKAEPKGLAKFLHEVGAELRKVVTPTRNELWRYTGVVLGFLVIMMLIVTALDFAFGFLSSWVFGDGTDLFPQPAPIPGTEAPLPDATGAPAPETPAAP